MRGAGRGRPALQGREAVGAVKSVALYALALALLAVAVDTSAQCPLARYCCDSKGVAMCAIEPTSPGLVCVCWRNAQGVAC